MIIVRIWEGLGNQMFQYAYAKALGEKGIQVRLDMNKSYDQVFAKYRNHTLRENGIQNFRISIPSIEMSSYKRYNYLNRNSVAEKVVFWLAKHSLWKYKFYEEEIQAYSDKTANIRGNYYLKGWFQSEKYFKHIRFALLNEFTPKKKIRVSQKLREAFEDLESVSLHVRRGDYVKINQALNIVYYKKAIEYIKQIYDNPIFLIFSDDLEWVKEHLFMNERYIYVNEDRKLEDYEELFIMSRCRSNIISNSTFSWWAAWLNQNENKTVIAPKTWTKEQGNIVPKEWTIL